jgi:hypothetical protein
MFLTPCTQKRKPSAFGALAEGRGLHGPEWVSDYGGKSSTPRDGLSISYLSDSRLPPVRRSVQSTDDTIEQMTAEELRIREIRCIR